MSEPASDPTPNRITTTTPAKRWFWKTIIIAVVLIGFGFYGLYDAVIAYPERGRQVASLKLFEYLETVRNPAFGFAGPVGIDEGADPFEVMADIADRRDELNDRSASQVASTARAAAGELALYDYLLALHRVYELTPESARILAPEARYNELYEEWRGPEAEGRGQPKPLSAFDLPLQWVIFVVSTGIGVWVTIFFFGVTSKSYSYDPETKRLTLPTGESLVPEDVAEFDKRKWDKFLIFLKMKDTHDTLGGRELKVDLYRYTPLEEWIIEMHRDAFPEDFEDEEADTAQGDQGADEAAESDALPPEQPDRPSGDDDGSERQG